MRPVPLALAFVIPLGGCLMDPPSQTSPYSTYPVVSFQAFADAAEIAVRHSDGGVTWRDIELRADVPVRFSLNRPLDAASPLADDGARWARVATQAQDVRPGDRIAFCGGDDGAGSTTVRLRHAATAQRLGAFPLAPLPVCPVGP